MGIARIASVVLLAGLSATATADEILFKNGDKLTGKIDRLEDGKLIVQSAVAGEIKVEMSKVKTFSTDAPIEIHLKDGTVVKQKVTAAEEGKFATAPEGSVKPQPFAIAEVQKVNPPKVKWTGDVSAGALLTRGNSNTDNANIAFNLVRRAEDDRITFAGGYLYGRQENPDTHEKSTTQDNWFLMGKYDYFFNPKFYGYATARVERDRIADLNLRFTPGAGVGYQWVEKPDFKFSTEGGVSWFYEDFTNATDTDEHFALRLAYHVEKTLKENIKLFHNLEYYPSIEDSADYFVTTDAGIRATLTKTMFTEFKVQLNYDSTPAEGAKHTDVRYIASVGFTF